MAILLKINTVDKTSLIDWRSLQKQQISSKEPDTLSFDIVNYPAKTYRPALGDDVKLYDVDGTTLVFGGVIVNTVEKVEALVKTLTVQCKDYTHTLDRKLVVTSYTGKTVTYIVNDLLTNFASGFTSTGTTDTTVVTAIAFNYLTISECLKKLVTTLGAFSWYVDYNKDVKFTPNGTTNAPFSLTDTSQNFIWESFNFNSDISQLRNHIILRGGTTTGTEYVDYKIADGQQNTFFVGYNLISYDFYKRQATPPTATFTVTIASPAVFTKVAHGFAVGTILTFTTTGALPTGLSVATNYFIVSVPTADTFTVSTTRGGTAVTTSGTQSGTHTYTVAYKILTNGLDGVVDPTTVDVVYNPSTGLVRFANSNTPILNDVVRWVGTPTYPLIAQKLDLGSIATYGTYQYVIIDANITSTASAGQRLTAELAKWGAQIDGGSFDTKTAGLLAGQNITVNSTIRNINKTFKIDRITTKLYKPDAFIYSVEVVTADVVTMQDVLNKLLVTNVSDQIDIGLNEVLQVLYSATETMTISEVVAISTSSNPQSETVTMGESTTVQALNYAVIFVAGAYVPTGFKRQFMLNSSPLG